MCVHEENQQSNKSRNFAPQFLCSGSLGDKVIALKLDPIKLDVIPPTFDIRHSNVGHQAILMLTFIPFKCPTSNNLRLRSF